MTQSRVLLAEAVQRLSEAGFSSPMADARWLLAHVIGVQLAMVDHREIGIKDEERFRDLLRQRMAGIPVQYLTGSTDFRYRRILVGPGVFIPRPETETVVEFALARLREYSANRPEVIVVDLGTGSGAIAGAIATEEPKARVYAVEKNPKAVMWARRNLADTTVSIVEADLGKALTNLDGRVDLVISNPPYVPSVQADALPREVLHDPHEALFGGPDGLSVIAQVVKAAARLLVHGGWLICEHDDTHQDSAPMLVADHGGFAAINDHLDLAGKPRFLTARRAVDMTELDA